MLKNLSALSCGFIFSIGLIVSQMVSPTKVLSFLDIAGNWDPSLAVVMAGALITLGLSQHFILRRSASILDGHFHRPKSNCIDRRLLIGASLFGIGWGLVGFCPGPAITAIGYGSGQALLFTVAMTIGMGLFHFIHDQKNK